MLDRIVHARSDDPGPHMEGDGLWYVLSNCNLIDHLSSNNHQTERRRAHRFACLTYLVAALASLDANHLLACTALAFSFLVLEV